LAKENDYVPIDSDTWNVGKGFSTTHILVPLINCQRYLDLCNRGVEDIMDIHFVPNNLILKNRIVAMESLLRELQKLITNTKFTMDKTNLKKIIKIKIMLDKVEEKIPTSYVILEDQRTMRQTYKIDEKIFRGCLETLVNALEEIKKPLNAKNLIFPSSGSLNLEDLKEEIMSGG